MIHAHLWTHDKSAIEVVGTFVFLIAKAHYTRVSSNKVGSCVCQYYWIHCDYCRFRTYQYRFTNRIRGFSYVLYTLTHVCNSTFINGGWESFVFSYNRSGSKEFYVLIQSFWFWWYFMVQHFQLIPQLSSTRLWQQATATRLNSLMYTTVFYYDNICLYV